MEINEILELINEANSLSDNKLEDLKTHKKEFSAEEVAECSNEHLCVMIASNRYLKIDPKMEMMCMTELANRRNRGDIFDFENKINEYYKQFTPIEVTIGNMLSTVLKMGKNL